MVLQGLVGGGHADDVSVEAIVALYDRNRGPLPRGSDMATGRRGGATAMLTRLERDGYVEGGRVTAVARRML
jgi:hypothetical protein